MLRTKGLLTFETGISNIKILSDKLFYIITFSGNCYKSLDGGFNWKLLYRNIDTPLYAVDFISENEGFIGGLNTTLWHTNTDVKPWVKVELPLNNTGNITNIYFINTKEIVFTVANQNEESKDVLLYKMNLKTKKTESILQVQDSTVVFNGNVYGFFKNKNTLYLLDRNNLYQLKLNNR